MSFFNSFGARYRQIMEKRAASLVYDHLKFADPESLRQAGISLDLFAQGPAAYPWRVRSAEAHAQPAATVTQLRKPNKAAIRKAIAELQGFSDVELADMGIHRGNIAHAVREGRLGVDGPHSGEDQKAAA